jgi:hypothetical protein
VARDGHVIGRIVRENSDPVKRTITFREVHPVLGPQLARDSAPDPHAYNVGSRELQSAGRPHPPLAAGKPCQNVQGQRGNEHVVRDFFTGGDLNHAPPRIYADGFGP